MFLPEYCKPELGSFFHRWAGPEEGKSKGCCREGCSPYFPQKIREQASHREQHRLDMEEISTTVLLLCLSMVLHDHASLTAEDQSLYLPLTTAQQHSRSYESVHCRVWVQIPTDQFFQSPRAFTICTVHTALQTQSYSSCFYHRCYAALGEDRLIC